MASIRAHALRRLTRVALAVALLVILVLAVAPAAPAARSGRVVAESHWSPWAPGRTADTALREVWVRHWIYDAQPTGTLALTMSDVAPEAKLVATDASGATVWSLETGDASAATGTLPAAFVATFPDPDPNVLRSGELRAYNADGTIRFEKAFENKFVQPLCDTPTRLVWAEVSAQKVTRVYVRQGSTTRAVALPYRPPRAYFINPAASSADGSRLAVGVYMANPSKWRTTIYWLRVSRAGVPSIVSHGVTDWPYLALSPDGSHAAVMSSRNAPEASRNLWVAFGKFTGRLLPGGGDNAGEIGVAKWRIFEQGGYSYQSDPVAWGASAVAVVDWSMQYMYQRAWVWDNASGSIWFRHDPGIFQLAGIDNTGALTVINVDTYAIATVPGTYADAVPLADGRLTTLTREGVLDTIPNPVAGP
ncbi:MAG: hypothetical protein WCP98_16710 [Actinomycetes bacterium]